MKACGAFEQNGYDAMRSWITEGHLLGSIRGQGPSREGSMSAIHEAGQRKLRLSAPEQQLSASIRSGRSHKSASDGRDR